MRLHDTLTRACTRCWRGECVGACVQLSFAVGMSRPRDARPVWQRYLKVHLRFWGVLGRRDRELTWTAERSQRSSGVTAATARPVASSHTTPSTHPTCSPTITRCRRRRQPGEWWGRAVAEAIVHYIVGHGFSKEWGLVFGGGSHRVLVVCVRPMEGGQLTLELHHACHVDRDVCASTTSQARPHDGVPGRDGTPRPSGDVFRPFGGGAHPS